MRLKAKKALFSHLFLCIITKRTKTFFVREEKVKMRKKCVMFGLGQGKEKGCQNRMRYVIDTNNLRIMALFGEKVSNQRKFANITKTKQKGKMACKVNQRKRIVSRFRIAFAEIPNFCVMYFANATVLILFP